MEQKEKYFVSDICLDLPALREYAAYFQPGWRKLCLGLWFVFLVAYVAVFAVRDPGLLKWGSAAALITIGIVMFWRKDGGKAYRDLLEQNGGVPRRNLCYIREEGLRYRNPETEHTAEISWQDIVGIARTRSFFQLTISDGRRLLVSHASLAGGTADELEQWLREKSGVTKVARPLDARIFRKAGAAVLALGFALSLVLTMEPSPKTMTASQAADVLTELGIRVPQMEIEDDFSSEYMVEELLYWAGMGAYDDDTFAWTPADSGVYAFDLEVFDVGNMYRDFLRGVEAMSGGELVFTEIVEDDSLVDLESGGGWKEVTFTVNGGTHTLRAQMMYDWFDPSFANAVAEMTEDHQTGKRLRFYFDGYQVAYVFWCDDDWARDFSRATGLRLSDRLE